MQNRSKIKKAELLEHPAAQDPIQEIESAMLDMPQIDCPVAHHFGPGIYIREVTLPAGIIALGHSQRFKHLNILVTGKVAIVAGDRVRVLEAPMIYVGEPGRKAGYVIETCVWQNIYATEETDIDKLEAHFLDKSDTWEKHNDEKLKLALLGRHEDRLDYKAMLKECGFNEEIVRKQSENEEDQIPMPSNYAAHISVRDSEIEGQGLFLTQPVTSKTAIAAARVGGNRTPAGRYVNHSKTPNCYYKFIGEDIYLVSLRQINGCIGGDKGEELTVDYRQSLSLSRKIKCQA